MSINDKIKQILIDRNLTPSYFADEIGVQRSSISHILSGRNRPSFDIIQKIIRRFPDLGYEWIMEEEPSSPSTYSGRPVSGPGRQPATERYDRPSPPSPTYTQPSIPRVQRSEIPPADLIVPASAPVLPTPAPPIASADKRVERILIFYSDGSFREYMPTP